MSNTTEQKKDKWKEITSVEAAFKWKGLDPTIMPDVSMIPEQYRKYVTAAYVFPIVVEALNDGWQPDYNNRNQVKYEAWVEIKADKERPSGFGFSDSDYDYWYSNTRAGSRLAYEKPEKIYHAFEYFPELFKDFYLK